MTEQPLGTIHRIDPTLLRSLEVVRPSRRIFLRPLDLGVVLPAGDTSPVFTEDPRSPQQTYRAADGTSYFLPQALIPESKHGGAPAVRIEKREGSYVLTVTVHLVRHASVAPEAQLFAFSEWAVKLRGPGSGQEFTLPTSLVPAPDGTDASVVLVLKAEGPVDEDVVSTIMRDDPRADFSVTARIAYRINTGNSPAPDTSPAAASRMSRVLLPEAVRLNPDMLRVRMPLRRLGPLSPVVSPPVADPTPPPPAPAPESRTATVELGPVGAHFPPSNPKNRVVYAAISSQFGANPGATWVETAMGEFVESAVSDQFHVVPDEYRLAFSVEQSAPAMSVLLVPGEAGAPAGAAYSLRVRFSIVPWLRPSRLEELRRLIAEGSTVAYPRLVPGGFASASFELSTLFDSIGGSLRGAEGGKVAVDPLGFELVLDCTSEFYNLVGRLVAEDGLTGSVTLALAGPEGTEPRTVVRPAVLRLDRPDTGFLTQRQVAPDEDPATPLQVVVTNPSTVGVRVGTTIASVLAYDEQVEAPVVRGDATAEPATFSLAAAAPGTPSEQSLTVQAGPEYPWGAAVVALDDVELDLDPATVLNRAQELGTVTGLRSSVNLTCYQLQHPEVLPEGTKDLHGIQVELRRSDASEPVTVYLTLEQPKVTVDVAFTLTEILAGASPEQPRFSWRRRNMVAAGNGPWSEWETIIGRELFVTPVVP